MIAGRCLVALGLAAVVAACTSSALPSTSVESPSATPTMRACQAPSPGSVPPTATTSPTVLKTATTWTSQWAQDPPAPLLLGVAVRVTVDRLNIRWQAPSTSSEIIGAVERGQLLRAS